jgi:hypothetical protein
MRRKDFLIGLAGAALGAPLGAIGAMKVLPLDSEPPQAPGTCSIPSRALTSYSQAGEDMAVHYFFEHFQIRDITYLDIGAADPILINNTYFFYKQGHRGVLVEPNVGITPKLRSVRPADIVLEAGIGVGRTEMADYYVMTEETWSTFDKAEVDHQTKATRGRIRLKEVRRMPLLNVNDVMAQHFKGKAPTYVSIDAEGWHLAILKSIDFARFRPAVICVETLVSGESRTIPEIPAFMQTKGYVARGGSFVNTIFVDSKLL